MKDLQSSFDANASPAGREGRRRATTPAAGRAWWVVLLAILGALLVAGLLAYDFVHLRRASDVTRSPATAGAPAASSAAAAPEGMAPSAAVPPPVPTTAPALAPAELVAKSQPATQKPATPSPRPGPEAPVAMRTVLLERAQAAFDEGNLDRAQSEARRAVALGSHEADALLGVIAFKRGHLDEAQRLLSKALQRDPGNPHIARQLQVVRAAKGP